MLTKQKWVMLGGKKLTSGQQKSDLIKCNILKRRDRICGWRREGALW